jgi:ribonuclease BN (tRNA processing enzyme)
MAVHPFEMTTLGTSAAYPTAGNPATGFLLARGGRHLQLDLGTGTFVALQEHVHFADLDAVVLTHTHADHCLDFYPLYYARRFHGTGDGDLPALPLWAPPGSREILAPIARAEPSKDAEEADKLARVFRFHDAEPGGAASVAGFDLTFAATEHPVPTVAVRVEAGGRALVFTADTGPGVDLADFARGADLLLAEATYQDAAQGPPTHLTARQAGELARRAGVKRLLLTHLWPTLDPDVSLAEARDGAGDGVTVELARPGVTVVV